MNYAVIGRILSWVLRTEGLLMLLPCLIALIYGEWQGLVYLALGVGAIAAGWLLSRKKIANPAIYQREGFVSVGLSWVVLSLYGAIPFVITGEIPVFLDALFEIVSGFTTTGSSILANVEALSHTSLFWRSFSHWIGGMGVLVFILMMIPSGSGGTQINLMKAESPGPDVSKFVPRVKNTAIVLYRIYLGMTLLMIAFGVNFSFYYLLLTKNFYEAFHLEEVGAYLAIILCAGLAITWQIEPRYGNFEEALRVAYFQVGSIITTTGFSTVDFDLWPSFSKTILVMLMIIGACAGSTGGGVKVSRVVLVMKSIKQELRQIIHPHGVQCVRMDKKTVDRKVLSSLYVYLTSYFFVFGLSVLAISLENFSFTTNFTAVAATLNNIGPGLAEVGPSRNFGVYGDFSKLVLIFDMLAGRLELLPMLLLFYPRTWSSKC